MASINRIQFTIETISQGTEISNLLISNCAYFLIFSILHITVIMTNSYDTESGRKMAHPTFLIKDS